MPWRTPQAYDDWKLIKSALYQAIVVSPFGAAQFAFVARRDGRRALLSGIDVIQPHPARRSLSYQNALFRLEPRRISHGDRA